MKAMYRVGPCPLMGKAIKNPSALCRRIFCCYLFHFLDDGENHRAALGAVEEVFAEGVSDLGLDGVPFGDVAGFAAIEDGLDAFSGFGQEGFAVSDVDEAAGDDVGAG